jgi:hypothetical protein
MKPNNEIFSTGLYNNIELIDGYVCIFESDEKERVKFAEYSSELERDILAARNKYPYGSLELNAAVKAAIQRRAQMCYLTIRTLHYCIEAFEDNVIGNRDAYEHLSSGSFEDYLHEYKRYWDAVGEFFEWTPLDEEPDESYLRAAHERFMKSFCD